MAKENQQTWKKKAVTNTFVLFHLFKKKRKKGVCSNLPLIYFCTTGGSQFSDVFTSSGEVCLLKKPKHLEVKEKQRQKRLSASDGQLAEGASGNLLNPLSCISLPKSRTFFFFFYPPAAARVQQQQMARVASERAATLSYT